MATSQHIHDVVQIGYGPVGQTMAALLGKQGHDVEVFERHSGLYALPRAGHIDHEIMRIFQSIDCTTPILEDAFRCSTYGWRNQHGEVLLDIDWSQDGVSGWPSDYLIYQPHLEDALDRAARRSPTVSVNHGWEAVALEQHDDFVALTLAKGEIAPDGSYGHTGEQRTVHARYLIGADGANSFVRTRSGLDLHDLGFREQWLVTDFRQRRPVSFDFDNGQICDPARPTCLFQLGKSHRRFEFMVMPGDDPAELVGADKVWELVRPWIGPDDAEMIRATVYTFRSATATRWRARRAVLVGDAAHLMPPFLGQGMCSGVRDAATLAWKLDLVLSGSADDALLDTYQQERQPHVGAIIEQAVALGRVSCTIDVEQAAERDEAFRSGAVPPPPPFPWIEAGMLQRDPNPAEAPFVGRLGPQDVVSKGASRGLADDVVGAGWQLILRPGTTLPELAENERRTLTALNVRVLAFGTGALDDVEGRYAAFFARTEVVALLVRPDLYAFGAAATSARIGALVAEVGGWIHSQMAEAA